MRMSIPAKVGPTTDALSLLGLAAAPVFALMACVSALAASGMTPCTAASTVLPIDNMSLMYLLMALFHLTPWLKLLSSSSLRGDAATEGE